MLRGIIIDDGRWVSRKISVTILKPQTGFFCQSHPQCFQGVPGESLPIDFSGCRRHFLPLAVVSLSVFKYSRLFIGDVEHWHRHGHYPQAGASRSVADCVVCLCICAGDDGTAMVALSRSQYKWMILTTD
jgi:hypothetical protein